MPHGAPYQVYLDQCALSRLITPDGKSSDLRLALDELQDPRSIQVFASAQNAVELCLMSDHKRRQMLALAVEELTLGRRIWPSYEFILTQDVLDFASNAFGCEAVNYKSWTEAVADNQRVYSALIAHMAALRDYDASEGFFDIVQSKMLSKIKHLLIMADPATHLELFLGATPALEQYEQAFDTKYGHLTIAKLQQEIAMLEANLKGVPSKTAIVRQYEQHRSELESRFCLHQCTPCVNGAFPFHIRLNVLELSVIVERWKNTLPKEAPPKPLLPDLVSRVKNSANTAEDYDTVLSAIVLRYARWGYLPNVMLDVCLREIERSLRTNDPPTEGLTLDMDHASLVKNCDVFMSYDKRFAATLRVWSKRIYRADGTQMAVCESVRELRRICGNP